MPSSAGCRATAACLPSRPRASKSRQKHKAEAAKANAEAQIKDLSKDYPIFAEDELPVDKRLDKVALAQASETQLASVLQAHIAHRQSAVADARGQLEGKHELVYKMSKLMPTFYAQMGIQPGSIHDQIIQDKMHSDAVAKVVTGILVAIVTVALTVVSLGTATPAVLAAGASMGAAGISTYLAYDEYKQYTEDHAIAEAGFANDPSVIWLVLAVVGAGADMASAVTVVSKLAPAAKALETEGKLIDFTKAVEEGGELARAVIAMDPLEGAIVIDNGGARAAIIDELASAVARLCFEAVTALVERPAESYNYRYFNADATAEIVPGDTTLVLSGRYIPTTRHGAEELLVALYQCGIRYLAWLERVGRSGHASADTELAHLRPLAASAQAALASRGEAGADRQIP